MIASNNYRKIWWAILTLLIINTLVLVWLLIIPKFLPPPHPPTSPTQIARDLKLNESQRKAFDILIEEHFKLAEPLRADINKLKLEAYDLIKNEKFNKVELEDKVNELTKKIAENELQNRLHFRALRDICNDEQKQIFDNTVIEKFKNEALKQSERRNQGPHLQK